MASTPASGREDRRPRLHLLRYEPAAEEQPGPPPPPVRARTRPTAVVTEVMDGADVRALRRRAEQVIRLTLEVLDGRRPVAQLAGHLEPRALRYVRAALAQRPTGCLPSRMTSLHLDRPCAGAVEVAAVYRRGPRARALAARFEPVRPGTAASREPCAAAGEPAARAGDPREWRCVTLRLL
ncbi:MAG TPA: Rv3235 family protein [Pseudonocardia sp.]|nr:Rv3235 family protein [Pseudonocardia sp.]